MSLLLLFKNPEGVVAPDPAPFEGPDTTVTWRDLLREAKIEVYDANPGVVSMDRLRQRIRNG